MDNPMDLADFPFDVDAVDIVLVNERACLGRYTGPLYGAWAAGSTAMALQYQGLTALAGVGDGRDTILGNMNAYTLRAMSPDAPYTNPLPIPGFCPGGIPPPFMTVYQWDGQIAEWNLRGFRSARTTFPVPKGGTKEAWVLALIIERKSEYYFWKAVLPLTLVVFLSCGVSVFPVEDLSNRMAMATTMCVSLLACLQ